MKVERTSKDIKIRHFKQINVRKKQNFVYTIIFEIISNRSVIINAKIFVIGQNHMNRNDIG